MTLRETITSRVAQAFEEAQKEGLLPPAPLPDTAVERPQNPEHGEYSTSLALKLARPLSMNPMVIAQRLAPLIYRGEELGKVEVTAPGFINFTLEHGWLRGQVDSILRAGPGYGNMDVGGGKRVQVEFVSVNPTGPLHVGAARWAVLGSALANVLGAAGYRVAREYYVNDAGSQMDAFYRSILARYKQAFGREAEVPANGYQGAYVVELGQEARAEFGDRHVDGPEDAAVSELGAWGLQRMLRAIREDLELIGVEFDSWFSERGLYDDATYQRVMESPPGARLPDGAGRGDVVHIGGAGPGQGQRVGPEHGCADVLCVRHRLPLQQVPGAGVRSRHRHLGGRPPGPRAADNGSDGGARG